jgi:rhodanese-related sulfurtransferase
MTFSLVLIILVMALVFVLRPKGNSSVQQLDSQSFKTLLATQKVQLIDVRTVNEYKTHHIKDFKNIPLQDLANRFKQISTETPVVLMCASGARSMQAASFLAKNGYSQIYNIKGGINSFRA